MSERVIVFVCTGNICRSPMAEYLLRDRLGEDSGWTVTSAGVAAGFGMPASPEGVAAMREVGIDMTGHRSRPLDERLVEDARLIVAMTGAHRDQIYRMSAGAREKVFLMKAFNGRDPAGDIEDPIGMPASMYRRTREDMAVCLPGLLDFLKQLE